MTSFLILLNAELFAPRPLGRRHLVLSGGRIAWIGTEAPKLPASFGAETVDLAGRRLIPGLIDAHAHVTGGGGECGPATRVPPVPLSRFTTAGVTTVVGLLGTDDLTHTTGELVAVTRGLSAEGIHALCYTGGYHVPPTTLTGSVRGDIVHIDCILGIGEIAISDHRSSQPTFDELVRLASEAHVAGLMTGKAGVLHLHVGDGERGLELIRAALDRTELPARTFHPTHSNRRQSLLDEAFALTERGCTIDVTAYPADDRGISAADAWCAFRDAGLAPGRITISSDGGGCLPTFDDEGTPVGMGVGSPSELANTLRTLLDRGVALEHALPAVTTNVAHQLRLHDRGAIEVGHAADLVALDDDHRITDVIANGRVHVRDGRTVIRGTFEDES